MGAGLADGRPDFAASGAEWRTSPLWGIGLTQTILPGSGYLHDGRARTLEEAILWHGGEAATSKESFRTLSAAHRGAVLAFLGSLTRAALPFLGSLTRAAVAVGGSCRD